MPILCFLPPLPPAQPPRAEPPAAPKPSGSGTAAIVIIVLVVLCAMLLPFGWTAHPKGSVRTDGLAPPPPTRPSSDAPLQ